MGSGWRDPKEGMVDSCGFWVEGQEGMVDSFGFWVEGTKFLHPQHPTAGRKYHVTVAETDGSRSTVCLCIVTFQSVFQ